LVLIFKEIVARSHFWEICGKIY